MKVRLSLACLALAVTLGVSAQQINPITKAMLDGYDQILKENPQDYQTLYERAAQLYRLSMYDRAMNDIVKAVEYTPEKEKMYKIQELSLLSDIAVETKNYDMALRSIDEALELDPDNYSNIYKKGNVCLQLNKPEEAYRAFSSMQRLKTRSQEAYFGMAQACIMMDKQSEASDLLKEAENADPSSYITYCRVGDLYKEMGQIENAASNYLIGISLSSDNPRPLNSLVELGKSDYPAVATALNYAIDRSTNRAPLLYLKGSIAQAAGYYNDAVDAFTELSKMPQGSDAGVLTGLAQGEFDLNNLDAALSYIDKAIATGASLVSYILKTKILLGLKQTAQAVSESSKAVGLAPENTEALMTRAYALAADKKGKEANDILTEIIIISPDNVKALLLRAYINSELLNNGKGAVIDFNRIIAESPETFEGKVCKGIALAKVGKKIDGDSLIEEALRESPTKDDLYYAAIYYAQTDNLTKGLELINKAIYEGYGNKFNLERNETPLLNIAPLRRLMKP
ncbi:MAG: hypothetical protein K2M03_01270 [Muribaculaceae bacterium]|nr:hypothetical protein [Muribaculaceae bacterium]